MITLTLKNLKDKKSSVKVFTSPVEAEKYLNKVITDPEKIINVKKGEYLEGFSYDTSGEKELIVRYLPESRKVDKEER